MIWLLLSKILPLFVYPVGLTILACLTALGFSIFGFARISRAILTSGILILWIASTPLFANWIYAQLEAEYPPVAVEALPRADVAIVLGGAVGQPLPPRLAPDAGEAIDRVFHAARIFHAGKVEILLASGGNLPWRAGEGPEAELIADLLVELDVPRQAIALETESRNTTENAVNSAAIIKEEGWHSVFLSLQAPICRVLWRSFSSPASKPSRPRPTFGSVARSIKACSTSFRARTTSPAPPMP